MATEITVQRQITNQIYLNSSQADIYKNGTMKSNVKFFINNLINVHKNSIDSKISVANAQFPNSFYLINSTNNQMGIYKNGVYNIYTFQVGNYNVQTFISMFATTVGNNFTITYSNYTNKINFSHSTYNFLIYDTNLNSIFPILGFKSGVTYQSSDFNLTTPYMMNFNGIPTINIQCGNVKTHNYDSYEKGENRLIASIPVTCNFGSVIFYNNITNFKSSYIFNNLNEIHIELFDSWGNYIDFNNMDWSMCLQIDTIIENIESVNTFDNIYEAFQQIE